MLPDFTICRFFPKEERKKKKSVLVGERVG